MSPPLDVEPRIKVPFIGRPSYRAFQASFGLLTHSGAGWRGMPTQPSKLRHDAIIEVIFEARFETSMIAELTPAALIQRWSGFNVTRLPLADVPAPIRNSDPQLAYQGIIEARNKEETRVVKVGEKVISYHALGRYPGWTSFKAELTEVLEHLYKSLPDFSATRFGLRYIDVFSEDVHGVSDISDLSIGVSIGGVDFDPPYNVNYKREDGATEMIVKVAGKGLFATPVPNATTIVDIDVSTSSAFCGDSAEDAVTWLAEAHAKMKEAFFSLFTPKMLENLTE